MLTFDASSAECLVFTFKDGLLSGMAHDLKIRVSRFEVRVDESSRRIEAEFDPGSLRVVAAVNGQVERRGALTPANKREIERNIVQEVLHAKAYPRIEFVSREVEERDSSYRVKGDLTLHGARRPLPVRVLHGGGAYVAEATLHQPDFGIRPYSAMFGTLKVKADVRVRLTIPEPR